MYTSFILNLHFKKVKNQMMRNIQLWRWRGVYLFIKLHARISVFMHVIIANYKTLLYMCLTILNVRKDPVIINCILLFNVLCYFKTSLT